MQTLTKTPKQTQKVAATLAKKFKNTGGIIALSGELGAGKTTFVQGFARALGIQAKIISPTFIITRSYPIPNTNRTLYHIDLYRLEEITQLDSLGLSEIFQNPQNLTLIEWPERLGSRLPKEILQIKLSQPNEKSRLIEIPN